MSELFLGQAPSLTETKQPGTDGVSIPGRSLGPPFFLFYCPLDRAQFILILTGIFFNKKQRVHYLTLT